MLKDSGYQNNAFTVGQLVRYLQSNYITLVFNEAQTGASLIAFLPATLLLRFLSALL